MTGITADLCHFSTLIHSVDHAATTLGSGISRQSGTMAVTIPQASRFTTALAATQERHATAAQAFTHFYHDAGVSLAELGRSLNESEATSSRSFRQLDGMVR